MKTSPFRSTAVALLLGLAGAAQAVTCTAPNQCGGPTTTPFTITVNDTTQPNTGSASVTLATTPIRSTEWIFLVNDPNPQDPATIEGVVEGLFGVNVNQVGSATLSGDANGSFTVSGGSFDYLAIHFGGSELIYHLASAVTSATITVANSTIGGLSNWRTFSTVPIPGAVWLFLSALGVFGLRRKFAGGQSGSPTAA
jgi:hypothetical protein